MILAENLSKIKRELPIEDKEIFCLDTKNEIMGKLKNRELKCSDFRENNSFESIVNDDEKEFTRLVNVYIKNRWISDKEIYQDSYKTSIHDLHRFDIDFDEEWKKHILLESKKMDHYRDFDLGSIIYRVRYYNKNENPQGKKNNFTYKDIREKWDSKDKIKKDTFYYPAHLFEGGDTGVNVYNYLCIYKLNGWISEEDFVVDETDIHSDDLWLTDIVFKKAVKSQLTEMACYFNLDAGPDSSRKIGKIEGINNYGLALLRIYSKKKWIEDSDIKYFRENGEIKEIHLGGEDNRILKANLANIKMESIPQEGARFSLGYREWIMNKVLDTPRSYSFSKIEEAKLEDLASYFINEDWLEYENDDYESTYFSEEESIKTAKKIKIWIKNNWLFSNREDMIKFYDSVKHHARFDRRWEKVESVKWIFTLDFNEEFRRYLIEEAINCNIHFSCSPKYSNRFFQKLKSNWLNNYLKLYFLSGWIREDDFNYYRETEGKFLEGERCLTREAYNKGTKAYIIEEAVKHNLDIDYSDDNKPENTENIALDVLATLRIYCAKRWITDGDLKYFRENKSFRKEEIRRFVPGTVLPNCDIY